MKLSNLNNPTPAKWGKIGAAMGSTSAFISASAFATSHEVIGYIALVMGAVGTFIVNLIGDEK